MCVKCGMNGELSFRRKAKRLRYINCIPLICNTGYTSSLVLPSRQERELFVYVKNRKEMEFGMNYAEAREYIKKAAEYGIVPGLDNITKLCEKLKNPQDSLNVIHIAGTNGKGSVGAFVEAVLLDAKIKVGRFASPSVFEYLEQFKINGESMSEEKYAYYISRTAEEADKMNPHPTPFEMETAAAFMYFADEKCDMVLLEAGMGGGMDATNVIKKSLVSVITPISMDHMQFLGDTIEEIAAEKAGIIKENGLVVSARQSDGAADVIIKKCKEKNAHLYFAESETEHAISLCGEYQKENAALAEKVCRTLSSFGVTEENIKNGLKNAVWHGRFEKICDEPVFIIDGAHNIGGAERLRESVEKYYGGKKLVYIMGVFRDKEYEKIAEITAPLADFIYTITPDNPRGLQNTELCKTVSKYNKNTRAVTIDEAVKICLGKTDSVIVAFGSLSFMGELQKKVKSITEMRRCSRILKNEKFRKILRLTKEAEKDRIYCNHGIEHLTDVARAAYIISLENGLNIEKELIYAAALVHDIGRYDQYANGVPHHEAGAKIAAEILAECGFDKNETEKIVSAIERHRESAKSIKTLADVIAAADSMTRMCMLCDASDTCKWKEEEKNTDLIV